MKAVCEGIVVHVGTEEAVTVIMKLKSCLPSVFSARNWIIRVLLAVGVPESVLSDNVSQLGKVDRAVKAGAGVPVMLSDKSKLNAC